MTTMTIEASQSRETEVPAKAVRRTFTKEYKLGILEKADRCRISGGIGKLLRQEGLYSSHLTSWRKERREGTLQASGCRRGPKSKRTPEELEIENLQRENKRLRKKLEHAEKIISVQKKLSEVLGVQLEETDHAPDPD
jgi:transposase-like protein